jgi:hypothetical protein
MIGVSTCGGSPVEPSAGLLLFLLIFLLLIFLISPGAIGVSEKSYRVLIERSTASLGQQSTFSPADF